MRVFVARRRFNWAGATLLLAVHCIGLAQDSAPNTQEMVEALKPRTRSLRNLIVTEKAAPAPADPAAVMEAAPPAAIGTPNAPNTAPTATPSMTIATAPMAPGKAGAALPATDALAAPPSLSMAIHFDFDSARLRPEGAAVLDRLAIALQTSELKESRFLIEGHTDAKGSADYNLRLSQLRADEVRRYLVEQGLSPKRLESVGRGGQDLFNPTAPMAAVNRRVRIVNVE